MLIQKFWLFSRLNGLIERFCQWIWLELIQIEFCVDTANIPISYSFSLCGMNYQIRWKRMVYALTTVSSLKNLYSFIFIALSLSLSLSLSFIKENWQPVYLPMSVWVDRVPIEMSNFVIHTNVSRRACVVTFKSTDKWEGVSESEREKESECVK